MKQSEEESPSSSAARPLGARKLALAALVWGLLCIILLGYNHYPGRLAVQLGEKSPRDVWALRTVKYFDAEETARLKEEAAQRAEPVYSRLPAAFGEAQSDLRARFDKLRVLQNNPEASPEEIKELFIGIDEANAQWLLSSDAASQQALEAAAQSLLRREMSQDIRDLARDLAAAQERIREAARDELDSARQAQIAGAAAASSLRSNRYLDAEATKHARERARAEVKDVERFLQAGDLVILEGERVTGQHLAMFRALGLMSPWTGGGWPKALALCLMVLLGVAFLGVTAWQFAPDIAADDKRLALLGLVLCVGTFAHNLFLLPLPNLSVFFFPAATLIIAVLLSRQIAFGAAVVLSMLAGVAAGGSLTVALPTLGACMAATVAADHIWPPSELLRASMQVALSSFILVGAAHALADIPWAEVGKEAGMAFGYGACAPLLALGAIFGLQRPFDITSHVRLLELSNPRETLLQRLQAEAPGTYYASIIVANLAEAAAQQVGADPLLTRVGALYHDIGKLRRPGLFVENQFLLGTENAHDRLSPYLSTLIILAHVKDGLELARRHGLPQVVRDVIEEHHGRTLVSYFYHQAQESQPDTPPDERHYRYEGRLPRSKEATIIMLADAAQAAAKSLSDPTEEQLESLVNRIVEERIQDGQLQDSEVTFNDLTLIKESFVRTLRGLHLHTRVQYPGFMRVLEEDEDTDTKSTEEAAAHRRPKKGRMGRSSG